MKLRVHYFNSCSDGIRVTLDAAKVTCIRCKKRLAKAKGAT